VIIVEVKLISAISPARNRTLGRLHITNVGGTATKGDYEVRAFGPAGRPGKRGTVRGYPRLAVAPMNLVRRALEAAGYVK